MKETFPFGGFRIVLRLRSAAVRNDNLLYYRLLCPSDVEYLPDGNDIVLQVVETLDLVHRNIVLTGNGIESLSLFHGMGSDLIGLGFPNDG